MCLNFETSLSSIERLFLWNNFENLFSKNFEIANDSAPRYLKIVTYKTVFHYTQVIES